VISLPKLRAGSTLAEEVTQALARGIAQGELSPGDKLPAEKDIAASMGVSRGVVREAIARLKQDGLLDTRQGAGAFVRDAAPTSSFRLRPMALAPAHDLAHVYELRREVESGAAAHAALRRTPEALSRIEAALAALGAATTAGRLGADEDKALHLAIAEASGNPHFPRLLGLLAVSLDDTIGTARRSIRTVPGLPMWVQLEHGLVVEAIRAGNAMAARAAMASHIDAAATRLGLAMTDRAAAPWVPGPDPEPRAPRRLSVPPGAVDCLAHIFGPFADYPMSEPRSYTPPEAPLDAYLTMLDALGLQRGVVVTPSIYGTDNRATLAALRRAPDRLRGVAVIDPGASDTELAELHAAGVRGVRANLLFAGGIGLAAAESVARRVAPLGWHLEVLLPIGDMPDFADRMKALPVPVVVDHMGHTPPAAIRGNPGFEGLLRLVGDGRAWVKLSGAYRVTAEGPPFADAAPVARALVAANPERCLFATDWPHPAIAWPMPNDGDLLDLLADWVPDAATRRRILCDNPAALYGFPPPG
jgi:DNA-binding FadR family transcriptional regulator/predicted TIM-barrel fold metal-dependent hydrolase